MFRINLLAFIISATVIIAATATSPSPVSAQSVGEASLADLCRSGEKTSQQFCLEKLEQKSTYSKEQLRALRELAKRDTPQGRRASKFVEKIESNGDNSSRDFGDPTRTIATPTAFTNPKGQTSLQSTMLGAYDFSHGVTDNVQVSVGTNIPVLFASFGASIRYGRDTEFGAIGATAFGRVLQPIENPDSEDSLVFGGVGPILTLGSRESAFTLGAQYWTGENLERELERGHVVFAHAGGFYKISKRWRLQGELFVPYEYQQEPEQQLAVITEGAQFGSRSLWVDIGLIQPIADGIGGFYESFPLGAPYLGFGASW